MCIIVCIKTKQSGSEILVFQKSKMAAIDFCTTIQFHKTPISPKRQIGLKQKFIAALTISSRTNLYYFLNKPDFSRPCKLIWINAMMKIMLIIHQKAVIHHPPGYNKYQNIFQNLFFNNLHPISFHKICSFPYLLQITFFFLWLKLYCC
jgi:hypothetical protein